MEHATAHRPDLMNTTSTQQPKKYSRERSLPCSSSTTYPSVPLVQQEGNNQRFLTWFSKVACSEPLANELFYGDPSPPQPAGTIVEQRAGFRRTKLDLFTLTSIFTSHHYGICLWFRTNLYSVSPTQHNILKSLDVHALVTPVPGRDHGTISGLMFTRSSITGSSSQHRPDSEQAMWLRRQFYPSIIGLEFSFPSEPSFIRSGDLGQVLRPARRGSFPGLRG